MFADRPKFGIEPDRTDDVAVIGLASRLPAEPRDLALFSFFSEHIKDSSLIGGEAFGLGGWLRLVFESNFGRLDLDAGCEITGDCHPASLECDSSVEEESRPRLRSGGSSELGRFAGVTIEENEIAITTGDHEVASVIPIAPGNQAVGLDIGEHGFFAGDRVDPNQITFGGLTTTP